MPTEKLLSQFVINKVDTTDTFDAMDAAGLVSEDELYFIEEEENTQVVDPTPTEGSSNLVSSGGVYQAIQDIQSSSKNFKPEGTSYLTFSSPSSFTVGITDNSKHWNGTLEYFSSDKAWVMWDGTNPLSAIDNSGEYVLYIRGTGNTVITGNSPNYKWVLTGSNIACAGNIENLLDYATVESGAHPTMANYCYYGMFSDCTSLTQAPALPATTLANYCCGYMFSGCTSLTQVPVLSATTLASNCYESMFYGCTSLTQAPALPATTLASNCYRYMFRNCTSLKQAPALPATTLAESCYGYMFSGCTSLTQAPALPATTLANYCYGCMFSGCTSLTQAPALPATTLAINCYYQMFYNCTSLIHAPTLPATTLASSCYGYMFYSCTSLIHAPALPATTLAESCYGGMFFDCSKIKLSSTSTEEYIIEYRIPSSGTGTTATNALSDMFAYTGGTFTGTPSINTTYYLSSSNKIVREAPVDSVNGMVGDVVLNAEDIGAAPVSHVSDTTKHITAAERAAWNKSKETSMYVTDSEKEYLYSVTPDKNKIIIDQLESKNVYCAMSDNYIYTLYKGTGSSDGPVLNVYNRDGSTTPIKTMTFEYISDLYYIMHCTDDYVIICDNSSSATGDIYGVFWKYDSGLVSLTSYSGYGRDFCYNKETKIFTIATQIDYSNTYETELHFSKINVETGNKINYDTSKNLSYCGISIFHVTDDYVYYTKGSSASDSKRTQICRFKFSTKTEEVLVSSLKDALGYTSTNDIYLAVKFKKDGFVYFKSSQSGGAAASHKYSKFNLSTNELSVISWSGQQTSEALNSRYFFHTEDGHFYYNGSYDGSSCVYECDSNFNVVSVIMTSCSENDLFGNSGFRIYDTGYRVVKKEIGRYKIPSFLMPIWCNNSGDEISYSMSSLECATVASDWQAISNGYTSANPVYISNKTKYKYPLSYIVEEQEV